MNIIQSFIFSVARCKLSLYEQRIMLKIIEHAQTQLQGKLIKNYMGRMDHNLDNVKIELPVRYILTEGSKHYEQVKQAAKSLMSRKFEYWDTFAKTWYSSPIIYNVAYAQGSGLLSFYVSKLLYDVALDFTKGFCRYDLETALSLSNPHAVRLYALLCSQSKPIVYPINMLKQLFGVDDKYKQTRDFILKVIMPAKKCLDDKECNSFDFNKITEKNKVTALQLIPIKRVEKSQSELAAKISARALMSQEVAMIMISYMAFTTKELNAHKVLLHQFCELPNAQDIMYAIERRFCKGKKSKGYVINAIKSEVDAWAQLQNKIK